MERGTVRLVSCVGLKGSGPAPARELYVSPWFKKARAYVEKQGGPWFILSAKYGLLSPYTVVDPYELTLNKMPVERRRVWAANVLDGLNAHLQGAERVEFLAGDRYREFLAPELEKRGIEVAVPMEGLGIGKQLAWLDAQALGGRAADLSRFYSLMDNLAKRTGGMRLLCDGRGPIPSDARGVYFFFEPGEVRDGSGAGPRVVRVGTHALKAGAKSTLWSRLRQHRGKQKTAGGNHRGSIFRLLTGTALMERDGLHYPSWGKGNSGSKGDGVDEEGLEALVSEVVQAMPFLWLRIDDEPGKQSFRGLIERNSIALLSNYRKDYVDPPSAEWLGHWCNRKLVRESGLWNQNHVDEECDPGFLDVLERLVGEQ